LESEGIKDKTKIEVIREIDKLDKLSEKEVKDNLKKYKAEKIIDIFNKPEKYFEKYANYKDIQELKKAGSAYGLKLNFLPTLARGLSYYNAGVFEVKTQEMKESVCGGGSYMFNGIQSTGISFGLERLSQLAKLKSQENKTLIISLGEDKESIKLASKLRKNNVPCVIMYNKVSKALDFANSYSINSVIFIGEEEIKKKKFKLKNMKTGKEEMLSEKDILETLIKK
jgi:histidyl-tRNA synthetase